MVAPLLGVLALQGAFREHREMFTAAGAQVREVRKPEHLVGLDAVVIPGGESTVMSKLLISSGLEEPLAAQLAEGLPAFGTCAGMILLAREIVDGTRDQRSFGAIDLTVRRNGIGPQTASHETSIAVAGESELFPAVFIRPPVVDSVGIGVEVLAELGGKPVLCSQGRVTVTSFHPEISGDNRIHAQFLRTL